MPTAILVGLPGSLRARVERHVARRVEIGVIPMRKDGGYRLEAPPGPSASLLGGFADRAPAYEEVTILLLPYADVPLEVSELAGVLKDLGATVLRPVPNTLAAGEVAWPPRPPRMDKEFQDALFRALQAFLDCTYPPEDNAHADREVACDMLRGLVVHSKMGPNNHSSENDLWKACGKNLGPGDRSRIVHSLIADGILARKKNKSIGGTGWVYWINDVGRARRFCPDLEPYFA